MHKLEQIEHKLNNVSVKTRMLYMKYLMEIAPSVEPYENRFDLSPANLVMFTGQVVRELSTAYYRIARLTDRCPIDSYLEAQTRIRQDCFQTLNRLDCKSDCDSIGAWKTTT